MKKLLIIACLLAWQVVFAQTPSFVKDSIDAYIQKGLKDWDVPGLAIVVVKDGQVVLMKGYGIKNIQKPAPVDENTLFMIASNTKLFTGTALALLEHQGKLSLNDKVVKYFPKYMLYDSISTSIVTIRDLLTHRIGTKTFQGDFSFWNTTLNREEIIQKMRLLKPTGVFRQDYGYCNSCFLTAGEIVPKVTGSPWEKFVEDSFLIPLEMKNTQTLSTGIAQKLNVATPYTTSFTGKLTQVPYDNWNNLAPAASIISNVSDLSHWLMMQLDSGRYKGKTIIPMGVVFKTRDVSIVTNSRKSAILPMHFRGYGLGVYGADYNGRAIYWHTGGAAGMVSNVCFVPEERLGIAILTNNDNQSFFEALRYQILDAYLGVPYVNRSLQQLNLFQRNMKEELDSIAVLKARVKKSAPKLPVSSYAGTYNNELYGDIVIRQVGNQLKIEFGIKPDLTATLDYMDRDEWLLQYSNIEYGIFSTKFKIENGKVISVMIKANDFVELDPYEFVKKN